MSVRAKVLKFVISRINFKLKALDWVFAKIMLLNSYKGKFFKNSLTYYRQYPDNIAVNKILSIKHIKRIISIKLEHFLFLKKYNLSFNDEIDQLNLSKKKF